MAETTAFDTLTTARKLKDAGIEDAQAEAITEAVRDAVTGSLATKVDIAELKADHSRLEGKIDGLEGKIDGLTGYNKFLMVFSGAVLLAVIGNMFV